MKQLAVCAALLLAACGSTTYPVMPPPEVQIVQLYGPSDLPYSRGTSTVEAQYGIQITNRSSDPVTLTHVSLQSVGGGTIAMRREDRGFNNTIEPGQTGQAVMNARVYFTSDVSGSPTREPLTVRATLSFNSPKGSFTRIVQQNLSQFPQQ
jgi:hypothetical protein